MRVQKNGQLLRLSRRQLLLVLYMVQHCHRIVSRKELHEAWIAYLKSQDPKTPGSSNIREVDVAILMIRRKLGQDFIETVRRCGYRIGTPGLEAKPQNPTNAFGTADAVL